MKYALIVACLLSPSLPCFGAGSLISPPGSSVTVAASSGDKEVRLAVATAEARLAELRKTQDPVKQRAELIQALNDLRPALDDPMREALPAWQVAGAIAVLGKFPVLAALSFEAIDRLRPDWSNDQSLTVLMGSLNVQGAAGRLEATRAWRAEIVGRINGDSNDGVKVEAARRRWSERIESVGRSLSWAEVVRADPDPDVVSDPRLRDAIVETGLPWRVRDRATGIELVLIPPGTFQMGCSASQQSPCVNDEREVPVHTVTLTNAFYMGRFEVTQAQWQARMGSNPSGFRWADDEVTESQVPNRPVEQVSWNMIQGFLRATGMRLPTEAEWEYAYRAGTTTAFHSMPGYPHGTDDDSLVGNIAWFSANSFGATRPVGQKAGNGLGLHDMAGNVWEWVNDVYSIWYYRSSPLMNPPGGSSGMNRVLRGGCWKVGASFCRSSDRSYELASIQYNLNGFRVARNP
jgi:formylglycine-generating enzyme required for sulfatase activity